MAPDLYWISTPRDEYVRGQPEYNVLTLEKASRDIQSRLIKQQCGSCRGSRGYLLACVGQRDKWPSMDNTTKCTTLEFEFVKTLPRATDDSNHHEHREKRCLNGGIAESAGDNHTITHGGRSQCHDVQVAQHNNISYTHHVGREKRYQRTHNSPPTEVKLMRTPRIVSEAKCHEQGHDTSVHDWTTTVSFLKSLQVYRGSMSSELPISHYLGAASEGGFRDIQVI